MSAAPAREGGPGKRGLDFVRLARVCHHGAFPDRRSLS